MSYEYPVKCSSAHRKSRKEQDKQKAEISMPEDFKTTSSVVAIMLYIVQFGSLSYYSIGPF